MSDPAAPEPKPSLFDAREWRQIVGALVLSTATLFVIAFLEQRNPGLAFTLMSSIGLHVAGARAPAILLCLARGMSPAASLFFNFYIEIIIVVLCYYSFVLIVREGLENRFLHIAAKQAEEAAQEHKSRIKRFELAGLFFLVMAPLPMTGPVTGSIVGYLLNLRPWVTFTVVFSGTFVALAGYVAVGEALLRQIIEMQARYQGKATLVVIVVIAAFTIFHVRNIVGWFQRTLAESRRIDDDTET